MTLISMLTTAPLPLVLLLGGCPAAHAPLLPEGARPNSSAHGGKDVPVPPHCTPPSEVLPVDSIVATDALLSYEGDGRIVLAGIARNGPVLAELSESGAVSQIALAAFGASSGGVVRLARGKSDTLVLYGPEGYTGLGPVQGWIRSVNGTLRNHQTFSASGGIRSMDADASFAVVGLQESGPSQSIRWRAVAVDLAAGAILADKVFVPTVLDDRTWARPFDVAIQGETIVVTAWLDTLPAILGYDLHFSKELFQTRFPDKPIGGVFGSTVLMRADGRFFIYLGPPETQALQTDPTGLVREIDLKGQVLSAFALRGDVGLLTSTRVAGAQVALVDALGHEWRWPERTMRQLCVPHPKNCERKEDSAPEGVVKVLWDGDRPTMVATCSFHTVIARYPSR